jgi:hypothetical protein
MNAKHLKQVFHLAPTLGFMSLDASAAPFVSGISGSINDGVTITIGGGDFGVRPNTVKLFDITSAQYVSGVNKNAYSGFGDGSPINTQVWGKITDNGSPPVAYSTSRPHRHPRSTAHYTASGPKLALGQPWESNGGLPPASQKSFYLSFYRRVKNPYGSPGGGDGSTKIARPDSPNNALIGTMYVAHLGIGQRNSTFGDVVSWIDAGTETTWVRWEIYVDVNRGWFDVWKNGHYHWGGRSAANGHVEFRPAPDWRFRVPGLNGYTFDAPALGSNPIWPSLLGYDDGHGLSSGQEIDVSEIYYDTLQARVEISDQARWDDSPTASAHREVQGRLVSWSDNQIVLILNQGGFDSLAGKYLYVIDAKGNVNANGFPLGSSNGCQTVSTDWPNQPFANQVGTFTAEFNAKSSASPLDGLISLSDGLAGDYADLAVTVRFNTNGVLDAINGTNLYGAASIIPYSPDVDYHFRLSVNPVTHTYFAFVTPPGGSEQVLAQNYKFRPEQSAVTRLNSLSGHMASAGTLEVCNFRVAAEELPILTIRASQVEICWNSVINKNYQLQYKDQFSTGVWVNLGAPLAGNGGLQCVSDPIPAGQTSRFYRVVAVP